MVVITSNGLSSDKLLYDLFPYTQNLSSAVIVKTASNSVPGEDKSLPWLEDELQMLRLSVEWFDFDTDDPAELLRYDVVEMSGGDPFYLRESIRKANAESIEENCRRKDTDRNQRGRDRTAAGYEPDCKVYNRNRTQAAGRAAWYRNR